MSTALSGPAAELGQGMQSGVLAAFHQVNTARQGIHGKPLKLISLDDGYEPRHVPANMSTLIDQEKVLCIVGNVGTPTAIAALPIVLRKKVLFFAPFTGAGLLRKNPPDRYVINYRASYTQETAAMIQALTTYTRIGLHEIAFFTQRDGYGDAGFSGGVTALRKTAQARGIPFTLQDVPHGRYERNTLGVENGLADILSARTLPRAVILVGAYEPCAKFVTLAKAHDLKALFLHVSFVGAQALASRLGKEAEGIIVTQVVPHFNSNLQLAVDYRLAMQKLDATQPFSFASFEGYIAATILVNALNTMDTRNISREALIDALEQLGPFNLQGLSGLALSPSRHQASQEVWPTIYRKGEFRAMEWQELVKALDHD